MIGRVTILMVLAFALNACRPHADKREARDFERMRQQQRYDPYERSSFFANGAVLQTPPAHTVAYDPDLTARGITSAGSFLTGRVDSTFVTELPFTPNSNDLSHGADVFRTSCAPCHGVGGFGGGLIAANLTVRRPPSLRSSTIAAYPPGRVFSVITEGFGVMPPYGWQLPPMQRWAVVAYVRSLTAQPLSSGMIADSLEALSLHRLDSSRAPSVSAESLAHPVKTP